MKWVQLVIIITLMINIHMKNRTIYITSHVIISIFCYDNRVQQKTITANTI